MKKSETGRMVKIGTRGSKLALWQAKHVKQLLEDVGIVSTLIEVKTAGDLIQDVALHQLGTVGAFTKALDLALLENEVDIVVHSSKDMPSTLHEELEIAAFLKREDPRDVLLAASPEVHFENFSRKLVIGTSSVRRIAFLNHFFDHVTVKDIRGNVDTRIEKMLSGEYDGILLALAGVKRMGVEKYVVQKLNTSSFTPAVGQGAIAVVCKKEFSLKDKLHSVLNHAETAYAVESERAFLRKMQGGCHTAMFGYATVVGDSLSLSAGMAGESAADMHRYYLEGKVNEATLIGEKAASKVLNMVNS